MYHLFTVGDMYGLVSVIPLSCSAVRSPHYLYVQSFARFYNAVLLVGYELVYICCYILCFLYRFNRDTSIYFVGNASNGNFVLFLEYSLSF